MVKPKRPASAYICYITQKLKELDKKEGFVFKDAFKELAAQWSTLTEEQKKPFHDLNKRDHERFAKETAEFTATGFFTNNDGVNSSTLEKKIVKTKRVSKEGKKEEE